ncbi:MAG TPA: cation:proton antiporter [Kofleriaceae bacterium]|nr:cation:proton antiporter [Kofleriaceae bacterium]
MTGAHVLAELVIVLGTAAVITLLFQALRLPVVLGYVAAGLVIGPHVPVPLVANTNLIAVLSELGVILLMFALGLELRISTLARVGIGAGLTALFEVALAFTASTIAARLLGASAPESLFYGACFAISSTMLVAKSFEEHGWKGGFTDVVFAILVFEDLIAIALLAVLTGVATGSGLAPMDLLITLGKLAGFLALLLVVGLLIIPRVIRLVAKLERAETLLIASLAICFGLAILTEEFHYPVALGAFVAGLLIAESGLGHEISDLVRPFRDVFAMMFFVSIGMTIEPAQLASNVHKILLFTAIVLLMKPIGVAVASFTAGRGLQPAIRSGVSLAQTGELSFVIAGIGLAAGVARPDLLAIAVGVTCLTTLTSSFMIGRSESIARTLAARIPSRVATFISFYESWLGRLRGRERVTWLRVRRPVFVLIADVLAIMTIVIAGSLASSYVHRRLGLSSLGTKAVITVVALVALSPFLVSIMRRVVVIARSLAYTIIPPPPSSTPVENQAAAVIGLATSDALDLGRAARRALTLTLELAIAAAIALPTIAAIQPFIGTTGLVALTILLVLLALAYRSIVDFSQHVRAGSELILELLHQPPPAHAASAVTAHVATDADAAGEGAGGAAAGDAAAGSGQALSQIESVLPGFGGLVSITIAADSLAIGRSLAELDLRARTGASVLAIARGEGGFATPKPSEPLQPGDVLALAGSDESIAAAREALRSHEAPA